jgi:hypothetical protein
MFRGQPGPGGQLLGSTEAGDVADLGDEHRGQDRPDPRDLLDRLVAGIGAQPPADQPGVQVDLEVQRGDHPQQRVDPRPGLHRQPGRGQQLPPVHPEQVAHRHLHTGAGEHGVDLILQTRTQPDQLRPVPHPAA